MQHVSHFLGAMACGLILVAGCQGFQPRPILEQELLRDLQTIQLETLRSPAPADHPNAAAPPPAFDPTDGLSSDEAVAVALFLNPALRTFRRERGVAEGELIAAGLLPNPEFQLTWLHIEHFTQSLATSGFDLGLNWAPPRPGELGAKQARAQARINEVRALIASEEWRLAADVRKAHAAVLAAEERLRLAEASLRLQERIRQFIRDKRQLGDASNLDVNLVDLEYAQALRERETVTTQRDRARLELNRLLGLPPRSETKLETAGDPLAYKPVLVDPAALESTLLAHRPDLLAAKEEYEQVEQSLRLAYLQRWPWFRFGPAYSRDEIEGKAGNRWGLGLGVDLPLANFNQGEIARLEATREQVRQGFVARLHQARAEGNDA
ncbi:MAG: TolC family protein, partial [Anaerolineales bacterium]